MEFLLFLNSLEMEILELISKTEYTIEENSNICLLGKQYFGFLNNSRKKLVICTENAKKYGGYYLPKINRNDDIDKTSIYVRKALRHEAVHIAQACNNGNLVNILKDKNIKLNKSKLEAIKSSTIISGKRDKEYEAYTLEDRPRLVIKALKKYCFD